MKINPVQYQLANSRMSSNNWEALIKRLKWRPRYDLAAPDNLWQIYFCMHVIIMFNLTVKYSLIFLQRVMAKCDKNLDDIITFEEFCIGMQQDEWRDMLWID